MKQTAKRIIKWIGLIYVMVAALVGTVVMAWPFIVLFYNGMMAPAPMPVYLPNGFIYEHDWNAKRGVSNVIKDKNNNVIIISDVRDVIWHENTIYGYRRGIAKEPYYYICTYGENCSNTQHLNEADFIRILKEKNLPEYDSRIAKTYGQLLLKQSKTNIGKKGG